CRCYQRYRASFPTRRSSDLNEADWITFETTVSTDGDQIAIAPCYLQKQWQENGRNYFHYKMDQKMLNFYAFNSARYVVKREKWRSEEHTSELQSRENLVCRL